MKEDSIEKNKDRGKYGWLPKMASCSKGSIGRDNVVYWKTKRKINDDLHWVFVGIKFQ